MALMAIGLAVVLTVYIYGWWKQRQYSRKFGEAFKQSHDDALYQTNKLPVEPDFDLMDAHLIVNQDAQPVEGALAEIADIPAAVSETQTTSQAEIAEPPVAPAVVAIPNEPCHLLDARSDFIITLRPQEASQPAVLASLWRRKFDFRKPVQVCGLAVRSGQWERVIAESNTIYAQFCIALQLVDRSGAITAAKLADFRDLVLGIAKLLNADTTVPDIHEAQRAAEQLDALCAELDQMVGVNLLPPGERQLNGGKIAEAAGLLGMTLESDGAFHLLAASGNSLITLINRDSKPFQHHTLSSFSTAGITLMLDVPRVERPTETFDLLVKMAHSLARELQVNLLDDQRVPLTEAGLAMIRTQIGAVEAKMCENKLLPGSAQARRLFS